MNTQTEIGELPVREILRANVAENLPQMQMAEETIRLLRDGDRMNEMLKKERAGGGMEQRIINVLAGLVLGFLGWWSNNIWTTVQTMQAQVTTLNVELARNYVPRVELQANFERIYNTLDRIDRQTKGARP